MKDNDVFFSRPTACAERVSAYAADAHQFTEKRVLLTGDNPILQTQNGLFMLHDSLRLLVRFCRVVDIWLPPGIGDLKRDVEMLAKSIQFTAPVRFLEATPDFTSYDAILSIGNKGREDLPWTVMNSNGWLARVSSSGTDLSEECGQANPIAALAAASLGVSEVFKRLIALHTERGPLFDNLRFSCYTFEVNTDDTGPQLPEPVDVPLTLVFGQGAIGNGITLLISQIHCVGTMLLLDGQKYGPENLGTCVLLGIDGVGSPKADWNASQFFLGNNLEVIPISSSFEDVLPKLGSMYPYPMVILNGLDNVLARRDGQALWPDAMMDGAIGDFGCQVATHIWEHGDACLRCLFTEPSAVDPALMASHATGLSVERARQAESLVTDEDVRRAPPEMQEKLRENIGRSVCSVVSGAIIAKMSSSESSAEFSPSVPFVATMSAAMVMAGFIRFVSGDSRGLSARFFFDILQGPQHGEHIREKAKPTCDCQARRRLIEQWRKERSSHAPAVK